MATLVEYTVDMVLIAATMLTAGYIVFHYFIIHRSTGHVQENVRQLVGHMIFFFFFLMSSKFVPGGGGGGGEGGTLVVN